MVEDFLSFFMPLCARSISSMKPYHAVLHIVFVFSTSHIYFYPDTRFISSFIWGSFIYDFYLCVYIYMNVIFVCIFYSVTGHHGRTVWLNGPPCINIFENKNKNEVHIRRRTCALTFAVTIPRVQWGNKRRHSDHKVRSEASWHFIDRVLITANRLADLSYIGSNMWYYISNDRIGDKTILPGLRRPQADNFAKLNTKGVNKLTLSSN